MLDSGCGQVRLRLGCCSGIGRLEVEAEPKSSRSPPEGDPSMGRSCPGAEPNESRSALEGELDMSYTEIGLHLPNRLLYRCYILFFSTEYGCHCLFSYCYRLSFPLLLFPWFCCGTFLLRGYVFETLWELSGSAIPDGPAVETSCCRTYVA